MKFPYLWGKEYLYLNFTRKIYERIIKEFSASYLVYINKTEKIIYFFTYVRFLKRQKSTVTFLYSNNEARNCLCTHTFIPYQHICQCHCIILWKNADEGIQQDQIWYWQQRPHIFYTFKKAWKYVINLKLCCSLFKCYVQGGRYTSTILRTYVFETIL